MKSHNSDILPYLKDKSLITIPSNKCDKIKELVTLLIKEKLQEVHYAIDQNKISNRFYTGLLGEAGLEEYLGIDIIDWTIGNSNNYNKADLSKHNINIGIKTVEAGKFPLIHKDPVRAEIITIKVSNNQIIIAGVASIQILKLYQDDSLILDKNLWTRGTKTGFWGFEQLISFKTLEELKTYEI